MLAEGLDLKGLSLCLFPLIFSYNRCRRIMFESEEALSKCFGYSCEYVNAVLKTFCKIIVRCGEMWGKSYIKMAYRCL